MRGKFKMSLDNLSWTIFFKPYIDKLGDNLFYDCLSDVENALKEYNCVFKHDHIVFDSMEDMVRFKLTWN
jgi:hypothetical protein